MAAGKTGKKDTEEVVELAEDFVSWLKKKSDPPEGIPILDKKVRTLSLVILSPSTGCIAP